MAEQVHPRSDPEPASGASAGRRPSLWRFLALAAVTVIAWQVVSSWSGLPTFLLPTPVEVGQRFLAALRDGSLIRHTAVTLSEVLAGLGIGLGFGTALGYLLAKSPRTERLIAPYLVASQAIPVVAIAPLMVIWLGPGRISKVLIGALIVFFPVLISTVSGIRSVPPDLRDLMRSLRATRIQVARLLEIPAASPFLLGGLKVGSTLAVIGAVVGEFVGADQGLGFLVNLGRGLYDTPLVFSALIVLVALALGLYSIAALIERRALAWRDPERDIP